MFNEDVPWLCADVRVFNKKTKIAFKRILWRLPTLRVRSFYRRTLISRLLSVCIVWIECSMLNVYAKVLSFNRQHYLVLSGDRFCRCWCFTKRTVTLILITGLFSSEALKSDLFFSSLPNPCASCVCYRDPIALINSKPRYIHPFAQLTIQNHFR